MKSIKIIPHNVQGLQNHLIIQLNDNDLFYLKAKRFVNEKIKYARPEEFVFYSRQRNIVMLEDDRVAKLQIKDVGEVELFILSDLIKGNSQNASKIGQQSQQFNQTMDFDNSNNEKIEQLEKELKLAKEEIFKISNMKKAEIYELTNQIDDLNQQILELHKVFEEQKQDFVTKQKIHDDLRSENNERLKQELSNVNQLKLQILQEQQKYEDLQYKYKEAQMEKDHIVKMHEIQPLESGIRTNNNDPQLQQLKFDYESIQRKLQEEIFQNQKLSQKIQELNKSLQELQSRLNSKIEELNVERSNSERDIQQLNNEINKLQSKIEEQKNIILNNKKTSKELLEESERLQNQIQQLESQLKREKQNVTNVQQQNVELNQEIEMKSKEIQLLKQTKEKAFDSFTLQNEEQSNKLNEEKRKLQKAAQQIQQQASQIREMDLEISNLKKQVQDWQDSSKKLKEDQKITLEKLFNELDVERKKVTEAEMKRQQLANRIKSNTIRKVGEGKIISPTEALMRNMPNPFEFLKNENIMTSDIQVTVEILNIDHTKAIESLTKLSDPEITKFVNRDSQGSWKAKKSLGINGDGTKRKGHLLYVLQSDGNMYNNQVFLIKELVGYEKISTIEKAMFVAQNHLIAQVLAQHYQEKMRKASSEKLSVRFKYPELYLLNEDGTYYIAEKLVNGPFYKYNGEGESQEKDLKVTSYVNAFSLFTYQATQQMLMVSNIQGIYDGADFIFTDPIISSPEGILGEEDLAEPHILQFFANYKENPKYYGKNFLSTMQVKI